MLRLYRWYLDRASRRRWSPDRSFQWRALSRETCERFGPLIEGFFAVEQYVPDYSGDLVPRNRNDYGRSQFYLAWGGEEARHADAWRNVLIFSGLRSESQLEEYLDQLRERPWKPPVTDLFEQTVYTVLQERATQIVYDNLARTCALNDPVLAAVCRTLAIDEAAHYQFFLESTRLALYFLPDETLSAISKVLRSFVMPAADLVPDYDRFADELYRSGAFGRAIYARKVARVALKTLGVTSLRARGADSLCHDSEYIDRVVLRLFDRLGMYEREIGFIE